MAYIDRDELLKFKEEMWKDRCDYMVVRVTNIMNLPTADVVKVKHGYWEVEKGAFELCGVKFYKCSVCNREQQLNYPYCPNCGAKMDLKTEPTYCTDKQNHIRHCEDCHDKNCPNRKDKI